MRSSLTKKISTLISDLWLSLISVFKRRRSRHIQTLDGQKLVRVFYEEEKK